MTIATPGEPSTEAAPARILVVDDEDTLRRLTRRHLEKAGYLCRDAADAAEARSRLEEQPFEVVLCDVRMPGESGLDLIRHITERHPSVASIIVTGHATTDTAIEALRLGVSDYLKKPFGTAQLRAVVAQTLESRKSADPKSSYAAQLFAKGHDAILKKIAEEAAETLLAAKDGDKLHIVRETADLWFHTLVMLSYHGLGPDDVLAELRRREGISGVDEKAARGT